MIASADVPNVPTTTTDPSSWRLDSQPPTSSKTGATLDRMTDATAETVNTTTVNRAAMATGKESGADQISVSEKRGLYKKS